MADLDASSSNNSAYLWCAGYQVSAVQRFKIKLVPATTNGGLVIDEDGWKRESVGVPPWIIIEPAEPVLVAL